jgi:hypothetical protein
MIPTRMRAQLINDIFSLAQANKVNATKPFDFIEYISGNENEYLVWSVCLSRIQLYIDLLESTELYGQFKSYLLKLIEPVYARLTWNDRPNDKWLSG